MSDVKTALRVVGPTIGLNANGKRAESNPTIPMAERAGAAMAARRDTIPMLAERAGTAKAAIATPVADTYRDLVADQSDRAAVDGIAFRAPGTPAARIRQRGRSPVQSGRANETVWVLTFEPQHRKKADFLMGWTGSRDTFQQVELRFATLDEAVSFAKRQGLDYRVETPARRKVRPKSYADNFRHDRPVPWTH